MGGVCSVCETFRIDRRKKCACGAIRSRVAFGLLFLRCRWCKNLFAWAPVSWYHMEDYPECCGKDCRARFSVWENERRRAA